MKKIIGCLLLTLSVSVFAAETETLKKEDQKYYKNQAMEGKNDLQRIDSTVKEINKLYGEVASLKEQINELKNEIQILKAAK